MKERTQSKSYSEKLKDPRWQKKRLEVLERDSFMCRICHDEKDTLHVHHIEYERGREPWDYDSSNFLTLCEFCHNRVTKVKDRVGRLMVNDESILFFEILLASGGHASEGLLHGLTMFGMNQWVRAKHSKNQSILE